mmetsp:Transcript_4806/g.21980  ORF Transcript_4806/g.21980 Transcript_4806/m.21980 type:complete len:223 (-) Transcript_4806:310-978(-)
MGGFAVGSLCADFTNAYCARALPTGDRATPSSLTNARGFTFLRSPRAGKSGSDAALFNVGGSVLLRAAKASSAHRFCASCTARTSSWHRNLASPRYSNSSSLSGVSFGRWSSGKFSSAAMCASSARSSSGMRYTAMTAFLFSKVRWPPMSLSTTTGTAKRTHDALHAARVGSVLPATRHDRCLSGARFHAAGILYGSVGGGTSTSRAHISNGALAVKSRWRL